MGKKRSTNNYTRHRIPVPFLLNAILVVIGIASFILFSLTYQTQLDSISRQENRFLTIEWELLQELKRQTDIQLLQKDREIADLRRQYRILMAQNASEETLQEMELRISIARTERENIVSRDPLPETTSLNTYSFISARENMINDPVQLTSLLAARIETLTAQLNERQVYARTIQEQLISAGMTQETLIPGEEKAWQEKERQAAAYEALVSDVEKAFGSIRSSLARRLADEENNTKKTVEYLETWVLLRAIATSPAIRSEYPDLAASMNRYLESFAEKERSAGRAEAYRQALDSFKSLGDMLEN